MYNLLLNTLLNTLLNNLLLTLYFNLPLNLHINLLLINALLMTSYTRIVKKVIKIYNEDMKYNNYNNNFKNK